MKMNELKFSQQCPVTKKEAIETGWNRKNLFSVKAQICTV